MFAPLEARLAEPLLKAATISCNARCLARRRADEIQTGGRAYAGRESCSLDFADFVGRFLISFPACCSASRTSCSACRFIQNCGLVPNQ